MSVRNIGAVCWKQVKDTFKNKAIFIQFVMFPLMAFLMENAVIMDDMPKHFFVKLFSSMYIGMAPLVAMSAVLAEEKEEGTLKMLMMSDVKPIEYLLGVGGYIWAICMAGTFALGALGEYQGEELVAFLSIMAIGIIASLLIGAAIGTWSKNQMMATSLCVPVMMVFSFLPMLSMFNETIRKMARVAYSEQISIVINRLGEEGQYIKSESIVIILINIAIAATLFGWTYRKGGLSS
ncbi:MAG: ABC transporter permease [Lachnospiraceae bacterium]|nr:ABC transporter permease [Lachnospiraceae bacterium]